MLKRYLIALSGFLLGTVLIAGFYFGISTAAQGWDSALGQFAYNRWYILLISVGFRIKAALYSILRFRLFTPVARPLQHSAGRPAGTRVYSSFCQRLVH